MLNETFFSNFQTMWSITYIKKVKAPTIKNQSWVTWVSAELMEVDVYSFL